MPPFRARLLKRKVNSEDSKSNSTQKESSENESDYFEESDDLFRGDLDDANDVTDSEPEPDESGAAGSDQELERVMFEDADANLDDEDDLQDSDQSSVLTDSEADADGDDDDDDESEEEESEDGESDSETSVDSGAESGPSLAHSSDEAGKKLDKENKPTPMSKVQKQTKKARTKAGKETKTSVDRLTQKIKESSVSTLPVEQKDEYESGDSSDEEDRRNTTGDVPRWWYDEYPHVGYDLDARRLMRPPRRDQIDDFLKRCEDPEFWRTVRDPSMGQDVILSAQDLELIRRIRQGHVPDASHDEYQPWVEWFSRSVLATPLRAFPDHKRSFLPSRSEQQQVSRIVHALKMGWTKTRKQIADERRKNKERKFYDLWGAAAEPARGVHKHIPAPRRALPAHAESYNPPPEYLLDHKEMKEWNKLEETPWKRKYTFLPTRHLALRAVPAYARFLRERFLRCLDLYLAPRAVKMRLTISAKDLVPSLPSPRELQPFPTAEALVLRGHTAAVRSIDTDPSGQYAVSGSDDGTLKVWELGTGRCLRTVPLGAAAVRVSWCPAPGLSLVAAAAGRRLLLLSPGSDIGAHRVAARTDRLLDEPPPQHDVAMDQRTAACVQWERVAPEEWARGVRVQLTHFKDVIHASWHARGDYLCVTLRDAASRSVLVHQLSRRRSQLPFRRARGQVQAAMFHPSKPLLFITTQRAVRIYDLSRQELVRKLQPGAQWNSAAALHPGGDNLLVASYDSKCMWFDLELSARPYQSLRLHGRAARAACFHSRYPLFATGGDDRYIVVSHGMVYNDLLQNPLLVPLRQLPSGAPCDGLVTLDLRFHPTQPWLLAACADKTIRLYS